MGGNVVALGSVVETGEASDVGDGGRVSVSSNTGSGGATASWERKVSARISESSLSDNPTGTNENDWESRPEGAREEEE